MFFQNKDISIYYEVYGDHPKSLLILPGWGDTRKTFTSLIEYLSNFFTVYIVDYPGFGNSPFPNRNLTIFDYSDCIYQFITEKQLDNPILIGHSFGGRIITVLAGYYQYHFSNIILMDSAGIKPKKTFRKKLRNFQYQFLKKFISIMPKKYHKRLKQKLFDHYASRDYKDLNQNMRETFKNIVNYDLKDYLKYIQSQVLLIWGNQDNATPIHDAKIMNQEIKKSELVVIDRCGHFPYLENPALIRAIIYEQLKEEIK